MVDDEAMKLLHGLPGVPPLIGQPEEQCIIAQTPEGKKIYFRLTGVAMFTDSAMMQLVQAVATATHAIIMSDLERRGVIPPAPPLPETEAPPVEGSSEQGVAPEASI